MCILQPSCWHNYYKLLILPECQIHASGEGAPGVVHYMKLIPLTGKYAEGKVAIVDDEDYEYLNQWSWLYDNRHTGYARRTVTEYINKTTIKNHPIVMHREITKVKDPKIWIDHINGDTLDNRKSNLRACTPSQNSANRRKSKKVCKSKYLGVVPYKRKDKIYWKASCKKNGKTYEKSCSTEIAAAFAYNELAIKYHGEFARLNIIENE